MIRVYTEYYLKQYYAPIYTCGSIFCIVAFAFTLSLPIVLAMTTNQFWVRLSSAYEQPKMSFNGGLFMNVLTDQSLSYCSVGFVNKMYQDQNIALYPRIEVSNDDSNNDGNPEQITLSISLSQLSAPIRQANLLIGLDYQLLETGGWEMSAGVFVTVMAPANASYIKTVGEVVLNQRNPYYVSRSIRQLGGYENLFTALGSKTYQEVFEAYRQRNDSLSYVHSTVVSYSATEEQWHLELTLQVPQQDVLYQLDMLESLRRAWIQYVSLFVVIYVLAYYWLLPYFYKTGIIEAARADASKILVAEKIKQY
jgi:hypothetical protein